MREVTSRIQPFVEDPDVRRNTFDEVVQVYALEEALTEAQRCILCKNARCQAACPLGNQIPRWMAEVQQGRVAEAYRILRETTPMPEICSRLCPQERLCEGACALGIHHEPVAIGWLERFLAYRAQCNQAAWEVERPVPHPQRKRLAAVGSGPASLAFAQRMAREGHEVTIFERWPRVGGVLRWIPRFKLPLLVLERHLAMLEQLGVRFQTGTAVQSVRKLLAQGFDGVFVGIGASRPAAPRIPGDDLEGVLSSTAFLVRVCYDQDALPNGWPPLTGLEGARVVVLGGGDSAMDCVRTAIRLNAFDVTCVYRRDEANMPGSQKEVKAAKEEGARFLLLASPIAFGSRDGRHVSQVECQRMELGPPDASGRRAPVPVEGSTLTVDADLVVLAFGYEVETECLAEQERWSMVSMQGEVQVNPATGATPLPGVVAGGDCVTGPHLVSTAARSGLVAAQGLLRYFAGEPWDTLAG